MVASNMQDSGLEGGQHIPAVSTLPLNDHDNIWRLPFSDSATNTVDPDMLNVRVMTGLSSEGDPNTSAWDANDLLAAFFTQPIGDLTAQNWEQLAIGGNLDHFP
jgi:hypothetical protein